MKLHSMRRVFAAVLAMACLASHAAMAQETPTAPPPAEPTEQATPDAAPAPPEEAAPEAAPEPATEAALEPAPAPKVWERCGVLYAPSAGAVSSKVVEGEHVADLGDAEAFVLPAGAPANVLAVQCARDAIMPEHNDYKVLLAGFPFSILTKDNRVAVLDVANGSVRLRTLQGSFTKEEQARLQDYLDEAQFAYDKAKLAAAKKKP